MDAVQGIKEVANLVKKFNDIELNRRILELENEVLDLSREKRRSEERVEELERALRFNKELVFRGGFYWLEGDGVPFCPACWDAKRLAIRIKRLPFPDRGHRCECPSCKTLFADRPVGI